jgi:type VII secretion protein EssB
MRISDGKDSLEFERVGATVAVLVTAAQIRMASVDVVRQQVTVADEVPEEYQAVLQYPITVGARPVRRAAAEAKTRVAKLQVAQKLASLKSLAGRFRVPFLHPENVSLTGAGAAVTHFGLVGMLAPMEFDEDLFLRGYKALILTVFHPRLPFEKLVDGSAVLSDPFSKRIVSLESTDEVASFIDEELAAESARASRDLVSVPKGRYRSITVLGAIAVVGAVGLGWLTYTSYAQTQPRQDAIIAAQSEFLTSDYARTLSRLQEYSADDLPKAARYVLAVSSVKLTDLTAPQKEAVLKHISTKSDDNTLNYWIHLARGDLDRALNLAQNLGDDQLTLLAYTDLYQATKLNSSMDGERKQKLLDEYSKKIEELTARLGAAQ